MLAHEGVTPRRSTPRLRWQVGCLGSHGGRPRHGPSAPLPTASTSPPRSRSTRGRRRDRRNLVHNEVLRLVEARGRRAALWRVAEWSGRQPYRSLATYEAADADLFVGRERLVAELTARVLDRRLVAVVGASGSGKSSLVRAGLLPLVRSGRLPGDGRVAGGRDRARVRRCWRAIEAVSRPRRARPTAARHRPVRGGARVAVRPTRSPAACSTSCSTRPSTLASSS